MKNKSGTPELSEIVRAVHTKLLEWEQEIEQLKKSVYQNTEEIEGKNMAPLLEYNAALKIARLGAELLERSIENRCEGLLLGLTQRPMFEGYVRGLWLQYVADEKRADGFLEAEQRRGTKSRIPLPKFEKMLNDLQNNGIEGEPRGWIKDTVKWIKDHEDTLNESIHMGGASVWMGWSNEYGERHHNDEQVIYNLISLIEIGSRCTRRLHTLSGNDSTRDVQIYQEKQEIIPILVNLLQEVDGDPEKEKKERMESHHLKIEQESPDK